jgi:hypothetical protein
MKHLWFVGPLIAGILLWVASPVWAQTSPRANRNLERLNFGAGSVLKVNLCDVEDDCVIVDDNGASAVYLYYALDAVAGDNVGVGPLVPSAGVLQYVEIDEATNGDRTIIAGSGGQTIKVLGIEYYMNAANNIIVKCAATTKVPVQNFAANSGVIRDRNADPWWTCGDGEAFILNLSASQQVSGGVWYVQD